MAEKRIEDLPIVSNVDNSIQFPVSQSGSAMRLYISDLIAYNNNFVEITVTSNSTSSSKTASEIYDLIINDKKSVIVVMPSTSSGTTYVISKIDRVERNNNDYTAFFYREDTVTGKTEYAIGNNGVVTVTDSYNVTNPNKNTVFSGTARLSLNYVPANNVHAVNKQYVDNQVNAVIQENKRVAILFMDENGNVFNGENEITGSQINAMPAHEVVPILWDEDNERLFQYLGPNGNGDAVFFLLNTDGSSMFLQTISSVSNDATFSEVSYFPQASYLDNGKVLGVVNGVWTKTGSILPAVTENDNGMVLGVVNGSWTLVDPSSFNE